MERSYDDGFGFSSQSIIAAAITAAELSELLHSPDTDDMSPRSSYAALGPEFDAFDEHGAD
jgi:hypothetical protein